MLCISSFAISISNYPATVICRSESVSILREKERERQRKREREAGSLVDSTSFNPADGSSCTNVVVKRGGSDLFKMSANAIDG